jgi:hypothetical protein
MVEDRIAGAGRGGDVCGDERAAVGRALDTELAVEGGKSVRQPDKPAPVGPGASSAVVAHLDPEGAVLCRARGWHGLAVCVCRVGWRGRVAHLAEAV